MYQLTCASVDLQRAADIDLNLFNAFLFTMPAYSVSTLVLHASNLPGDFDVDGDVDGNDCLLWQRGESPNGPTSGDLASWQANFGMASISDVSGECA